MYHIYDLPLTQLVERYALNEGIYTKAQILKKMART